MNLIDKDALIESLGIETDCYDCEHETIIYHCDLDPVEACTKIVEAPVVTVTTKSAEKAIEVLKNAAWLGAVYSFEETEEAVKTAIRALQVTSAQHNVQDSVKDADCISRQQAIDALGEEPPVWYDGEDEIAERNQWRRDVKAIKAVPSAQPEFHFDEWCVDCKEYDHDKHCCPRFNKVIRRTVEELKAQWKTGKWIKPTGMTPPEYKGVYRCSECGEIAMRDWKELHHQTLTKYCPNCGAKMEGEEHD